MIKYEDFLNDKYEIFQISYLSILHILDFTIV